MRPHHPFRPFRPGRILTATVALALAGVTSLSASSAVASAVGPETVAVAVALKASAALTANWYESAPYYYTLDSTAPALPAVMAATGEKAFELAFVLSGGGCSASWDGTDPVSSDTQVAAVITSVRAAGGDVSVSAGGYGGTKLGQTCSSAATTAAAYQSVISKYALHAIDFDLEEPEIEDSAAIARELGAAQILQGEDAGLIVSVTIPSTGTGANFFGQLLLDEAKSLGFVPDDYSIMPFDGGFSGAASQDSALSAFNAQLVTTFGWTAAQAWNHEGISQMNGRTDTGEYFYTADFATTLGFAESKNMSRYTFWSVNRDRQCTPPDNNGKTSGECSSVPQAAYAYADYDTQFAKWAPTSAPKPPPPPNAGACVGAWNSATAYSGGAKVSYKGHNWTAKWWTQGDTPGGSQGVWTDDGPCKAS